MFYWGADRNLNRSICIATSKDLLIWEKHGVLMGGNKTACNAMIEGNILKIWYLSYDSNKSYDNGQNTLMYREINLNEKLF
jgi:hypothetical protein